MKKQNKKMTEKLKPCAHCGSSEIDAEYWMADDEHPV